MVMKREQQTTFASTGFERFSRQSKRAVFLAEMDAIVPWRRLCALIQPHYPTGEGGRPPIPLERMLRIYFLQQWLNLSDPAVEEALYDMASMGAFAGVDLGDVARKLGDERTRRFDEAHALASRFGADDVHGAHVGGLALELFDGLVDDGTT